MKSESEEILLFQQGDLKSFDELFYQFYPPVLYFAMKLTGSRESAEEIVMDSFKKLWTRRESFETKSAIKAWLFITTKNACFNYLHAQKRRTEIKNEYQQVVVRMQDDENSGYNKLKEHVIFRLYEEINNLPAQRRAIMKLRLEGNTNPQIARILNISVFTVRNQIALAFKNLKVSLLNLEQLVCVFLLLKQLL